MRKDIDTKNIKPFEWYKNQHANNRPEESHVTSELESDLDKELARLRQRRLERQAAREQRLSTSHPSTTDKLSEDWLEKEQAFLLEQFYQKAFKRFREHRATLVDFLAINTFRKNIVVSMGYLSGVDEAYWNELVFDDPISIIEKHQNKDQMLLEIKEYMDMERDPVYLDYWKTIIQYLDVSTKKKDVPTDSLIKEEISDMFSNKNYEQLCNLEARLKENPRLLPDPDYREQIMGELLIIKLSTHIKELNRDFLTRRQKEVKVREPSEPQDIKEYSPPLNQEYNWDPSPEAKSMYWFEVHRPMSSEECPFNVEAEDIYSILEQDNALFKPKYYNRARATYEWNKYNQTHYDTENPPPKSLQGFRFNIFYPLLSSGQVPQYSVEDDPNSSDGTTKLLWFRAGSPYQSIVFRIPNIEWDISAKHGFRCTFERGILKLHFWFVKQRYRKY